MVNCNGGEGLMSFVLGLGREGGYMGGVECAEGRDLLELGREGKS